MRVCVSGGGGVYSQCIEQDVVDITYTQYCVNRIALRVKIELSVHVVLASAGLGVVDTVTVAVYDSEHYLNTAIDGSEVRGFLQKRSGPTITDNSCTAHGRYTYKSFQCVHVCQSVGSSSSFFFVTLAQLGKVAVGGNP